MNEKLYVVKIEGRLVILTEAQYEYYLIHGAVIK